MHKYIKSGCIMINLDIMLKNRKILCCRLLSLYEYTKIIKLVVHCHIMYIVILCIFIMNFAIILQEY